MRLFVCNSVELPTGELPEWIHVVPFGEWRGHHTVELLKVGQKEAAEILANFERRKPAMIPVDYDHQSMNAGFNGQPAIAAGWLDMLEIRPDGIWAHVHDWTEKAASHLVKKEYRYQSPVLVVDSVDPQTGEPTGCWLHSVALTNNPFFAGVLTPVVNNSIGGTSNMLLALLTLLGLPKEGTEKDVTDGVTALVTERDALKAEVERLKAAAPGETEIEVMSAACSAAGLDPKKKLPKDAAAKVRAACSRDGLVPALDLLNAQQEIALLKAGSTGDRVEQLACRGVETGKITPALKGAFVAMAKGNFEAAATWLDNAPVIVPLENQGKGAKTTVGGLTAAETAACNQLGIKAEDYLKQKGAK